MKVSPSATNALSAKVSELKKAGIKVHNFAAGDPVLPNHPAILQAVADALKEGMSPYAPVAGLPELRTAAAKWMNSRYGSHFKFEETVVTCGGKFALYGALQVLLEPGDEVLVPAPYWVSYPELVRLSGGVAKIIHTTEVTGWKFTAEELLAHITPKTRVLILNNACNPTAALYKREEIEAILAAAEQAGIFVLSDEVYSEIVYGPQPFVSCAQFPKHFERVIVVESCSKNFAMAGWRVGFAFGPRKIIEAIIALQSQSTTGTSFLSQKAALGALLHANEVSTYVREAMRKRRDVFMKHIHEKNVPESGLYFFKKIDGSSLKFCEKILEEKQVAIVPGIAFGCEGYVRFVYSDTEEEIIEGLSAFFSKPA